MQASIPTYDTAGSWFRYSDNAVRPIASSEFDEPDSGCVEQPNQLKPARTRMATVTVTRRLKNLLSSMADTNFFVET